MSDLERAASPRGSRSRFAWVVARTALALWSPLFVVLLLEERVRREALDLWFWPGLVPARFVFDDLYTPKASVFVLLYLVVWTIVGLRWRWLGLLGALLSGFVSMGHLMAVLNM